MDSSIIASSSLGTFVGAVVGSVFTWLLNNGTRNRLRDLEENRMRAVENDFRSHVSADQSQGVSVSLVVVNKKLDKIDNKMDLTREDIARIEADTKANTAYINNLDRSFQLHKQNGHGHA